MGTALTCRTIQGCLMTMIIIQGQSGNGLARGETFSPSLPHSSACCSGMQLSPLLESDDGTGEEQNGHVMQNEWHVTEADYFFDGRKRGRTSK